MSNNFGSAPLFFMSPEKQKGWDEVDPAVKRYIIDNLANAALNMSNKMSIELLCHVINDLDKRIKVLEQQD